MKLLMCVEAVDALCRHCRLLLRAPSHSRRRPLFSAGAATKFPDKDTRREFSLFWAQIFPANHEEVPCCPEQRI